MQRTVKLLLALLVVVGSLASTRRADAYAWMIRHDYSGCATCHTDPSGGGLLTAYGRAQSDILLSQGWGRTEKDEARASAAPFFGWFGVPDRLEVGAQVRTLTYWSKVGSGPAATSAMLMQSDALAQLTVGRLRGFGSIGFQADGGRQAAVTRAESGNLVSREHWLGVDLGADDQWLVRAGRMALPFGLRLIEHTTFVRQTTRTDVNDGQQHGVSLSYGDERVRGELMAIAGNYQLSPDGARERGYSGFVEVSPFTGGAVGVTSLVTHAADDAYLHVASTRQAHGAFVRYAPWRPLVLLAEEDWLSQAPAGMAALHGHVGFVQADLQVMRGLHVLATGEVQSDGVPGQGSSWGATGSIWWFAFPHVDLRVDASDAKIAAGPQQLDVKSVAVVAHLYL